MEPASLKPPSVEEGHIILVNRDYFVTLWDLLGWRHRWCAKVGGKPALWAGGQEWWVLHPEETLA